RRFNVFTTPSVAPMRWLLTCQSLTLVRIPRRSPAKRRLQMLFVRVNVAVRINRKGPGILTMKRAMSQPFSGRMEQDHVLVLPHKVMRRTRNVDEHLFA